MDVIGLVNGEVALRAKLVPDAEVEPGGKHRTFKAVHQLCAAVSIVIIDSSTCNPVSPPSLIS